MTSSTTTTTASGLRFFFHAIRVDLILSVPSRLNESIFDQVDTSEIRPVHLCRAVFHVAVQRGDRLSGRWEDDFRSSTWRYLASET